MKVTGTWEVPMADPRRFNVVSRDENSIVLEDTDRGRRHKIVLENSSDFENVIKWDDITWWNFLFLDYQL